MASSTENRVSRRRTQKVGSQLGDGEYTVDDLARVSGTTVRNIRAYQDRGLLPSPEKRGRIGVYTEAHASRLRVVNELLDRGYTIANIKELLEAWAEGRELIDIIGLETAITMPFSEEQPRLMTLAELMRLFGLKAMRPGLLEKVVELELVSREGTRFLVHSPRLLEAGGEMAKAGIELEQLLEIVRMLRGNVERVANELVQLVARQLDQYGPDNLPPIEDLPELAALIQRMRPLAHVAIRAEADRALQKAAQKYLGERLSHVIDHLLADHDEAF